MSVHLLSPEGLLRQNLYHHVAASSGTRQVHLAGQVAMDADERVLANDLGGQIVAALRNVVTGLAGAGARTTDLVRLTMFVVDWTADKRGDVESALARAQTELGLSSPLPPLTVIGVQALYVPELFVEVEATAVLDE